MKPFLLCAVVGASFAFTLSPVMAEDHSAHMATAAKPSTQVALSEGTIRRLDRGVGSVTLTHGPIENLGMSAMTMTFSFKKGVVPVALKEGDKVRFRAEEKDGQYRVVRIEAAK
jgi:Cu(I)/Ag(I) efflux system protein CusF